MDSTIKPSNRIECQFHIQLLNSQRIQPLNPQVGFNVNSFQREIQPLNPQIGFNVNSIQRQIRPLNPQI